MNNLFETMKTQAGEKFSRLTQGAKTLKHKMGSGSLLLLSVTLGTSLIFSSLYSTSYAITVDGEPVAVVSSQKVVKEAIEAVEADGSSLLGYDYQVSGNIDYQFGLTLRSDLSAKDEVEEFFYDQLDEVSAELRKCQVLVNGHPVGIVKDETALNMMLAELKSQYVNDNTTSVIFLEDVTVKDVYTQEEPLSIADMRAVLESNAAGETTYSIQKGDTFNKIAYSNGMTVSQLKELNPEVDINRLFVGQVLNVRELIPVLSVQTVEHQVYTKPIESTVETREDANMYKGESKILSEGVAGEAEIEANVTFVNGREQERVILRTTTVREATPTIKVVGTKEKPKTASTGKFSWPIKGRITSSFGGRRIFGRYNSHSGIDISASYGAPIKAADGGTVTFAGYKGTYGKLVIITHDNGTQTYYGHNSALTVSVGQKVYKGQQIAKAGSTGRSTGTHCHFEVRVHGTAVNPLKYLK